jgi:hypothetical protein
MPPKAKATTIGVEAPAPVLQPSIDSMPLEELQDYVKKLEAEKAEREKKIEELEGKEEGWLVWVDNPLYDDVTDGVQFTNGQAWIPKDRIFPHHNPQMPTEREMQAEANDRNKFDHKTTLEDVRKEYAENLKALNSAERTVIYLTKGMGYHSQYFSKADFSELEKMRNARAKERAEVQAKFGTMKEQIEKLEKEYAGRNY